MIKSSYTKILSILFIMFVFATKAFCANPTNTLSEVKIDITAKNIININLLFKNDYKERAFLQKQKDGSYYVFLPNTTPIKNTKITYNNVVDKQKIRMTIEGKTAIKDEKNYSYTKITTDINPNYGIKLISSKQQNNMLPKIIIGFVAFLLFFLLTRKKSNGQRNRIKSQSFTYCPSDFNSNTYEEEYIETKPIIENQRTKEKNNSFKISDKASFDCFNIPQNIENNNKDYEFKSMLKQTSNALNNQITTITHKHTNPITKIEKDEHVELEIPSVSDVFPNIEKKEQKTSNKNLNVISVLNITPNKGFYLTTMNDTIALFGFVNKNIFLFNKFKDLSQINLQARFYDRNGDNDIYIVRLDSFKAMIEISETSMKELARI